ncbi:HK97 gp10 family phage protein [Bacillus sp. WMMC1349]|uniref:HK97-gp10 family putative phage morphogenesis protein n=1 Tax=Bacillus sp. WMMC1349 TaxID=2736254 RepID=UPI001553A146|nr:HK97-gp10 family putative phage morphogenesis protein [Bacillus sp. WMMC1349]NPC94794.1 HK97 gp10 family phage protein [Bacillus sp. WMMC1349]NPC94842.1 HK97 gp10 family phage protein [Bacillus sp. WMMC1349]
MARQDDGTRDIAKELDKLARKRVKAAKVAVQAGAEIFADGLERNTPSGRNSSHRMHMKNNVVYSKPREDGEIYSSVGYGKETASRLHFSNFGTIKQRPQHFIERTTNELTEIVLRKVQEIYTRELGL